LPFIISKLLILEKEKKKTKTSFSKTKFEKNKIKMFKKSIAPMDSNDLTLTRRVRIDTDDDIGITIPETKYEKKITKKDNSKKKDLKEETIHWMGDTSTHGFAWIVKNRFWFVKLFWILLLTCSAGYCFYGKMNS
jgi:hypothetical protein